MAVKRIVANLAANDPQASRSFYETLFGLDVVMDHGWIVTFASTAIMKPQLSVASEGGSGTMVPQISIEVDDVDNVYELANAGGHEIVYEITDEPWGVRRFYVRDPSGAIINVLQHK
ncbi:VOC family protein [Phyllobacterium sp. YR531]|uniref:VOC family protein n=1 Tax=Phyllobacterium sp. YR531 TaxID=1144343 RepID=UPI00026F7EEA|nr:VOC family protein [Phyllobacterium sp. YR531]EJM98922.1 lactoylglutathione lyase family protein [Phyllobacterium sp. YR531]